MAVAAERDLVAVYDEPFGDGSAIPCLYVSELARRDVKVVLSGEGGDEVFGGYNWYGRAFRKWRLGASQWLSDGWHSVRSRVCYPRVSRASGTASMAALDPLEWHVKMVGSFLRSEKQRVLSPKFFRQFDGYDDYWHFRRFWRDDLDEFSRMQYLDLKTYLPDDVLTKMDRASMAVSLEARVPLLDHELVETVLGLPQALRNKNDEQKYLFKAAMQDALPAAILTRRKMGFSMPLNDWLRHPRPEDLPPIDEHVFNRAALLKPGTVNGNDMWAVITMNRWLSGASTSGDAVSIDWRTAGGWTPPQTHAV